MIAERIQGAVSVKFVKKNVFLKKKAFNFIGVQNLQDATFLEEFVST